MKNGCNRFDFIFEKKVVIDCEIVQGKISGEEGWISLGPWGGEDGVNWAYKADGPIMQISICYGLAIDSILIESKSCDGVIRSSEKFGGTGGYSTETVRPS
ncbi:hypothetical protein RHSIM_Rhsim12G0045500 [Rhododendron simsii]|uniref:Jacalin-type lectin domain-containing protein n=1 Tax=Rhododendron simsii TaxID=118357 RepID=A0A834G3B0_RHOSS|nr:hypothetical protein RHSIM_Rhsim12G0045500 [Rhododendron simsii]